MGVFVEVFQELRVNSRFGSVSQSRNRTVLIRTGLVRVMKVRAPETKQKMQEAESRAKIFLDGLEGFHMHCSK